VGCISYFWVPLLILIFKCRRGIKIKIRIKIKKSEGITQKCGMRPGECLGLMLALTLALSHRMGEGMALVRQRLRVGCPASAVAGFR
jgi:hypothetical protein